MFKFPEFLDMPLDRWVDKAMDWLLQNLGGFFDAVGNGLLQFLLAVERMMLWIPWFVVLAILFILAWRAFSNWKKALFLTVMFFVIGCFGYWELAMMTLSIVISSVIIALLIGIPTGILMSRSDTFQSVLRPILDAMQTMPSFVYLIPALMLFGLGKVPATFATIIYAVPPVIRLTNVGIRQVPKSVIEAAQAFGAGSWEILLDVQLPLARPSILVGVNQTTMMALAMVVIGSMIGAKGLGLEVLLSINRIEVGRGFEAGLSIVFLAIIIDRLTTAYAKAKKTTYGE